MADEYYKYLIEEKKFLQLDKLKLFDITRKSNIPALSRRAAIRLYEFGEKAYALNYLIEQMNQYKNSNVHEATIRETCTRAAIELGELRNTKAIEPLFESLKHLGFSASYALSKFDKDEVRVRLMTIAKDHTAEAIYAAVALGYMHDNRIVPRLVEILKQADKYEKQFKDKWMWALHINLIRVLGAYDKNDFAEESFKKFITKNDISGILRDYLYQKQYPVVRGIEYQIVFKYGWDRYFDSDAKEFACRCLAIDMWDTFHQSNCPFTTQSEIEKVREQIASTIWHDFNELLFPTINGTKFSL